MNDKFVSIRDINKEIAKEWKCDHLVHTVDDLSDGNWHELKDGSTTIIPDPFKKEEENVNNKWNEWCNKGNTWI